MGAISAFGRYRLRTRVIRTRTPRIGVEAQFALGVVLVSERAIGHRIIGSAVFGMRQFHIPTIIGRLIEFAVTLHTHVSLQLLKTYCEPYVTFRQATTHQARTREPTGFLVRAEHTQTPTVRVDASGQTRHTPRPKEIE